MDASMEWSELRPIIDEEIAKLPSHYQTVLILCQLNGLTKLEAARQLDCPEGTISSRLMRAKEMLQNQLSRRGVTIASLAVLDALLTSGMVSAQLAQSTVGLAMKVAWGTSLSAGTSISVLTLAQGATQAMVLTKVQMVAVSLVLAAGLTWGAAFVSESWGQDKQAATQTRGSSAVKPAEPARKTETTSNRRTPSTIAADSVSTLPELTKVDARLSTTFNSEMTLDDRLNYLEKESGLPCIVDTAAFRETFVDFDQKTLLDEKLMMPRMANQTASTIIHSMLENLRYQNQSIPSTFLIRRGTLVIVPKDYVAKAPSKIQVAFDAKNEDVDLVQALDRLSLDTGVSIILDQRVKAIASDCRINVNFRNLKLINAVKLLANMADLTVINIDGALYVSNAENCKKMEDEMSRDTVPPG